MGKLLCRSSVSEHMILKEFPNLDWLKNQAEKGFFSRQSWNGNVLPSQGWPNVILNVSTRHTFRNDIRGPLSLFTNLSGESNIEIGKRRIKVREDFFFVTNHDQYYTLDINHSTPVETFNIHFGEHFTDQVFSSLTQDEANLMENPFNCPGERLEFHNQLYHRDEMVSRLICDIRNQPDPTACWLEEKLYSLVANLLTKEKNLLKVQSTLPALKTSTRNEILKRLLLVTDYIHEHLQEDLSLEQLAKVGCLSKFHFLRLFKVAFEKTPNQYVNELRMEKGEVLIRDTRLDIHEIALSLGYANASSFSRSFFNHLGVYPTQFRRAVV